MYPNTEFFLVRIFPHLDWIRRDTLYLSVFSPNEGKYGPAKTPYFNTSWVVNSIIVVLSYLPWKFLLMLSKSWQFMISLFLYWNQGVDTISYHSPSLFILQYIINWNFKKVDIRQNSRFMWVFYLVSSNITSWHLWEKDEVFKMRILFTAQKIMFSINSFMTEVPMI